MHHGSPIKPVLESKQKEEPTNLSPNLTGAPWTRTTPPFAHHYALQGREKEHPPYYGLRTLHYMPERKNSPLLSLRPLHYMAKRKRTIQIVARQTSETPTRQLVKC